MKPMPRFPRQAYPIDIARHALIEAEEVLSGRSDEAGLHRRNYAARQAVRMLVPQARQARDDLSAIQGREQDPRLSGLAAQHREKLRAALSAIGEHRVSTRLSGATATVLRAAREPVDCDALSLEDEAP